MCFHNQDQGNAKVTDDDDLKISDRVKAEDIPLGTGLADSASNSILSRRERIRAAVEAAGG